MSFKEELLVYFRMAALFAGIIYIPGNVESSQNLSRLIFRVSGAKMCLCIREDKFAKKNGSKRAKISGFFCGQK